MGRERNELGRRNGDKGTTWTMERKREIRIFPLFLTGHLLTQYFIQRIPLAVIKYHLPFMFLSVFQPLEGHHLGDIYKGLQIKQRQSKIFMCRFKIQYFN